MEVKSTLLLSLGQEMCTVSISLSFLFNPTHNDDLSAFGSSIALSPPDRPFWFPEGLLAFHDEYSQLPFFILSDANPHTFNSLSSLV
jgi:hypothetical protein